MRSLLAGSVRLATCVAMVAGTSLFGMQAKDTRTFFSGATQQGVLLLRSICDAKDAPGLLQRASTVRDQLATTTDPSLAFGAHSFLFTLYGALRESAQAKTEHEAAEDALDRLQEGNSPKNAVLTMLLMGYDLRLDTASPVCQDLVKDQAPQEADALLDKLDELDDLIAELERDPDTSPRLRSLFKDYAAIAKRMADVVEKRDVKQLRPLINQADGVLRNVVSARKFDDDDEKKLFVAAVDLLRDQGQLTAAYIERDRNAYQSAARRIAEAIGKLAGK